jgi:hypothetical protein
MTNVIEHNGEYRRYLIPDSLINLEITNMEHIYEPGFKNTSIKQIKIHDTTTKIDKGVFENCQ